MAAYFVDSSAVVKRYISETGSAWVRRITDRASDNHSTLSAITLVEVTAAIVRRERGGSIRAADAAAALGRFRADLRTLFRAARLNARTIESAARLAEHHALRGYDAVQLAAALEVSLRARSAGIPLTFVSSDAELNAAASANGLLVEDPNLHP